MAYEYTQHELEAFGEGELEAEMPEMFGLDDVTSWASNQWTALNTPGSWQRKALLTADKAILTGGGAALGASLGGTPGGVLGGALGAGASTLLPDQEFEAEAEFELESEFESELAHEAEISPVSRIYPDAMMEHLGHAASEAESEHEAAEGFLPLIPLVASKLVPLAAKVLPKVAGKLLPRVGRVVSRVTPQLTQGVGRLARTLYRNPRTRPLLRTIPSVARRTVTTLARQAAHGRPVTPRTAIRTLALQNHRVLSNPRLVRSVLQRSQAVDGRYHKQVGLPAYGRHYRWRWRDGLIRPGAGPGGGLLYGPGYGRLGGARICPRCGTRTVVARGDGNCCGPVVIVR